MLSPVENTHCYGHGQQEAELLGMMQSGRLGHSWIFAGAEGIGKETFAFRFARFLLSGASAEGGGLLGDLSMEMAEGWAGAARLANGSHPDMLVLQPEFSGQNQVPVIKIEAARQVKEFFSLTASESPWRIAIINQAEAMNDSAANALLKIIEEPPAHAMLILITHRLNVLLPTLRSRCRLLRFSPLSRPDFDRILSTIAPDIPPATANDYFLLSGGSVGRAMQLHEKAALECYVRLLESFCAMPKRQPAAEQAVQSWVEKHAKQSGFVTALAQWQQLLQRLLRFAHEGLHECIHTADEAAIFATMLKAHAVPHWLSVQEAADRLIADALSLHLDRRPVFQQLFELAQQGDYTLKAG